ncbi:MAG: hypothetical protein M1830_002007 [Pleopsidium flavum]|nr:MAG: hypothetical protein M1830_002007 [Pleopsidium flavum]
MSTVFRLWLSILDVCRAIGLVKKESNSGEDEQLVSSGTITPAQEEDGEEIQDNSDNGDDGDDDDDNDNDNDNDEFLAKRFGTVLDISDDALIKLVLNIRAQHADSHRDSLELQSCSVISRLEGSYNRVHILQFADGIKYVIRVPCFGWGDRWTKEDAISLRSQALTMRYIKSNTALPLPEVYAYDATFENEIGAPYIGMSFVEGVAVDELWHDSREEIVVKEARKRRILDSIAIVMSELHLLSFDKFGALEFKDETAQDPEVGPNVILDEGSLGDEDYGLRHETELLGPFDTTQDYFHYCFHEATKEGRSKEKADLGIRKLLSMIVDCLPFSKRTHVPGATRETFVLSPPDFGPQNILVNENGEVTGIIDWDGVSTRPQWLGCSSYPLWLMRDWSVMYNWPAESEDSPEQLEEYRRYYAMRLEALMDERGGSRYTKKSDRFEAVMSAIDPSSLDSFAVDQIMTRVLPGGFIWGEGNLIERIAEDKLQDEEEAELRRKFEDFFQS